MRTKRRPRMACVCTPCGVLGVPAGRSVSTSRGRALARKHCGDAARGGNGYHDAISAALRPYGARLTDEGFIARGDKVLGVRLEVSKGRLRAVSSSGDLLASFPASRIAAGVSNFVERFWYWKPEHGSRARTRSSRGSLWTVDYRAVWPDGRGLWRVGVVRAMSAAEAVNKLRALEKGVRLTKVRVEAGHKVPGYPMSRVVG